MIGCPIKKSAISDKSTVDTSLGASRAKRGGGSRGAAKHGSPDPGSGERTNGGSATAVAAGERGRPSARLGGRQRESARVPRGDGGGRGRRWAGVYLLTILPVYQSPAVDSLRRRGR